MRDGAVVWGGVQPEIKDVLELFAKWYKDGVLDPEFVTGENQGGYWALSHAFINGRIGMTGMGSIYHWNYPYFEGVAGGADNTAFLEANPNGSYDFGTPATKNGVGGKAVGNIVTGYTILNYKLEDEPEKLAKICEIIEALAADYDLYLIAKYGIQGEHWDFDENGVVVANTDVVSSLEVGAALGLSNMMAWWQNMQFYMRMNPKGFEFYDATVGKYPKYISVVTLTLPSQADYKADLDKLQSETFQQIITGALPIDAFDTFVASWKAGGGDTLTMEANDMVLGG